MQALFTLRSGLSRLLLLFCLLSAPFSVSLAASSAFLNAFPIGNLTLPGVDDNAADEEPLEPDQAFPVTPPLYDGQKLFIRWDAAPDYYLYKHKFKVSVLNPDGFTQGELQLPSGKIKHDEFFGEIEALFHQIDLTVPLTLKTPTPKKLQVEVSWQGCAEKLGICYPPEIKFFGADLDSAQLADGIMLTELDPADVAPTTTPASSPATPPAAPTTEAQPTQSPLPRSEQDSIADTIAAGNIPLTLLTFLGFGLLLAFTPCVFPMIPILSGIIAGQKNITSRQAFVLSLVYVLAMALTYTVVGVLAGLFGANLQATFQNPWILSSFSIIFVLLALSMFGFYELQMPASLQSRLTALSNQQSGGTLTGVAIMGVLSALIVGPCVAAPLAGALIYIGQTGDALLGGAALFFLSLGMGIPLLIIGTSAGKFMPRAGAWMESVRAVFGVLLLAVAIWMLERILPPAVALALWAALLVVSAIYMGALATLPATASGWQKLWKGIGLLLLIHGSLVMVGAAGGGHDVLQPLKGAFSNSVGAAGNAHSPATAGVSFRRITGTQGLQQALAEAKGKAVMLDFYADWCVSCKEMEKYTFPDAQVQAALAGFVLLQADVTGNTLADKELMKQFGIFGPPAMLFFDREGVERKELRLVGFLPAEKFAPHVHRVGQTP